jgi:hypothetical protein
MGGREYRSRSGPRRHTALRTVSGSVDKRGGEAERTVVCSRLLVDFLREAIRRYCFAVKAFQAASESI